VKKTPLPTAPLAEAIDYYLALRRQLGFCLEREGAQLLGLANYAQETQHVGPLTVDLMVRWAQSSTKAGAHQQARRLGIARRFAQFWAAFAPETEVPSAGQLGPSNSVRRAHIYSHEQVSDLLNAAGQLRGCPAWRGLTYQTLFGLLACTGLRISEALQLQVEDFDGEQSLLTLRHTKGAQSRQVVLHPSALAAMQRYDQQRPKSGSSSAFFSLRSGPPVHPDSVYEVFSQLRRRLGWPVPGWRLHDLRHTFAVNCLIGWYQQGADLDQKIPALSTYLGHARPENTYWYLSAVPELMALVQARWKNSPLQPSPPALYA
jgi:integrase